jgi:hypothetical protein
MILSGRDERPARFFRRVPSFRLLPQLRRAGAAVRAWVHAGIRYFSQHGNTLQGEFLYKDADVGFA